MKTDTVYPKKDLLETDIIHYLGTSGGISLKYKDLIYLAPSGVQKERIEPEHLFVFRVILFKNYQKNFV